MNQEPDETTPRPEAAGNSGMTDTPNTDAESHREETHELMKQEEEGEGNEKEEERSLNFIDHLDEIRGRIIKTGIALVLMVALSAIFADFLVEVVIIGPLKRSSDTLVLQNLVPYGQISLYLR